jgi:ACT domain-containing protein
MMMIVDSNNATEPFGDLADEIAQLGESIGVQIKMQSEDIFNIMHRI